MCSSICTVKRHFAPEMRSKIYFSTLREVLPRLLWSPFHWSPFMMLVAYQSSLLWPSLYPGRSWQIYFTFLSSIVSRLCGLYRSCMNQWRPKRCLYCPCGVTCHRYRWLYISRSRGESLVFYGLLFILYFSLYSILVLPYFVMWLMCQVLMNNFSTSDDMICALFIVLIVALW